MTKSAWLNFWVLGIGQSSSIPQGPEAVLQLLGSQFDRDGEVGSAKDFGNKGHSQPHVAWMHFQRAYLVVELLCSVFGDTAWG